MQIETSVREIMEADHVELDQLLADLVNEIFSETPDLVLAYRQLDLFWARLAVHIRAEHLVVFPTVIETADDLGKDHEEIAALLQELRHDHDFFIKELARSVKAMRLVPDFGNEEETFEVVRNLVKGVKQRLTRHNQIEEDNIYPLAVDADGEPGRPEVIRAGVLKELSNLPHRFRDLDLEPTEITKTPRS